MPRGSKGSYTAAQKRKAEHIEDSYLAKGMPEETAKARAWATVNKQSGGGEKSGSGRTTSANDKARAARDSAKRAAATRKGLGRNDRETLLQQTRASLLYEARQRNIPGRSSMNKQALVNALQAP
ncbi:termination factor Rho [Pseudomonas sp. KNUC1026]|uniref:termination factor Rho n=1 Tax=Pseudomonas sp. KNUC1026 TaxID=2893890 RepID=UPI001F2BC56A|nr:termination factor Rho [Pseudomonas sp. KNUC1026]UFH51441.1 termination factor Rho [Pseudomonas sp. KNUC1026]